MTARKLVEQVLGPPMTRKIWSSDYRHVIPVSMQLFDLSAVFPAVFYMFRFGHRRGKGSFVEVFGKGFGTPAQRRRSVTVEVIADKLAGGSTGKFSGFEGKASRAILGDLLLCYCLDNARYSLGRDKQVQRVAPAHYMSSWIDLPESVANLRHVPEMIVALLANQDDDPWVRWTPKSKRGATSFPVGEEIRRNVLLRPFAQGISLKGTLPDDYAADRFDGRGKPIGIDQLLMIRLAQRMGNAPAKSKPKSSIPNRLSIAAKATRQFSEDVRKYLRAYADRTPRQSLLETLECCLAVGLTSVISSIVQIMDEWGESGDVDGDKRPCDIFVDCSAGADAKLRALAEQSMEEFMRRARRLVLHFMALRLLDYRVSVDFKMKKDFKVNELKSAPNATEWINFLADILHGRHEKSAHIMSWFSLKPDELAEAIGGDYPDVADLASDQSIANPVIRLAEGLAALQGRRAQIRLEELIDSSLLINRPNGLARKRKSQRTVAGARRTIVLRSTVFTDAALEYLVHLLLLRSGDEIGVRKWFSFNDFIKTVQQCYGFCVDRSPGGMNISNDLLQRNRSFLDRRLRDLGLLVSVNDAEAMKRLTPRFKVSEG